MHRLARLLKHVIRLELTHDRPPASTQWPVRKRVDMEQEQASRPHKSSNLGEDRTSKHVGKHVQGNIRHHRVETFVRKGKRRGHVGNEKPDGLAEFGPGLRDGLSRHVERRHGVAFASHARSVVSGSATELKDGARLRGPERSQERAGPPPAPVEIVTRLAPLPEELIPEQRPGVGHRSTLPRLSATGAGAQSPQPFSHGQSHIVRPGARTAVENAAPDFA